MAWSDRTLVEMRRAKRHYAPRLLRWPNVVGVGIGRKLVGGEPQQGRSLRVYVKEKISAGNLGPEFLPTALPLPPARGRDRGDQTVALDIVEVGEIKLCSRPLIIGEGCSRERPLHFDSGTMGAIVADQLGRRYLLSNNHVLADVNRPGGQVTEPSAKDGGTVPNDVIGTLERYVELLPLTPNRADAALALLRPGVDQGTLVKGIGSITQVAWPIPVESTRVRLFGHASQALLQGSIVDREVDSTLVNYKSMLAELRDLVMIDARAQEGDSGSLVVTETGRAVGLVVSCSPAFTFVCPLKTTLDLLGSSSTSTGATDLALTLV